MTAPSASGPSPTATPASTHALARERLRRLPVAAGAAAAAASAFGALGARSIAWAALALAAALLAVEGSRRLRAVVRAGGSASLALVVVAGLLILGVSLVGSFVGGDAVGWTAALTLMGLLCVLAGATGWQRSRRATPWTQLSGGGARELSVRATQAMTIGLGLALLLVAAYIALGLVPRLQGAYPVLAALLFAGVGFVLVVAVVVVWLLRMTGRGTRAPAGAFGHPHDEQTVAAHLHDSVLQTLALINRNAGDPARVQQLARQQERSLRAWLAGRDEATSDTLAGAVRVAAQEVEDEEPGARIEVVAVGDAPLDRAADVMVRAAREAMRNAVRHAGSPVRVFIEIEGGVREVFIRDTGAGFDLAEIAKERRGVRDAIIGRMEHVGGTATIDSSAGGTEIALRYDDEGAA